MEPILVLVSWCRSSFIPVNNFLINLYRNCFIACYNMYNNYDHAVNVRIIFFTLPSFSQMERIKQMFFWNFEMNIWSMNHLHVKNN